MATTEFRKRVPPKRILVVEDEKVATLSIGTILAAEGHVVEIAEDAAQALVALQSFQYNLVLTNFKLPNMDGLELAAAIKLGSPGMPIILITAHAEKIVAPLRNPQP